MNSAIEVLNLRKEYRGRAALNGLSVTLAPGQIVGLMGDNGSGKTTLLKILAGVLAEWEGDVRVAGLHPGPESKALVSFLPDTSFLSDAHKPADSIAQFQRFFTDFDAGKAREMVDFFGLPWDRTLKEMSKGMREKLQISLAMSRRAKVSCSTNQSREWIPLRETSLSEASSKTLTRMRSCSSQPISFKMSSPSSTL